MFQVMNYVLSNEKIRDFENVIMRVAHHPYSLTFIPKHSNMGPLRQPHKVEAFNFLSEQKAPKTITHMKDDMMKRGTKSKL